jgi:hypothetical protein
MFEMREGVMFTGEDAGADSKYGPGDDVNGLNGLKVGRMGRMGRMK